MKRQFLLLFSLLTLAMAPSVHAQKVIDVAIDALAVGGRSIRRINPEISNPATVPDSIVMDTYGSTRLWIQFQNHDKIEGSTIVELRYQGVAAYLGLPDTVIVQKKDLQHDS